MDWYWGLSLLLAVAQIPLVFYRFDIISRIHLYSPLGVWAILYTIQSTMDAGAILLVLLLMLGINALFCLKDLGNYGKIAVGINVILFFVGAGVLILDEIIQTLIDLGFIIVEGATSIIELLTAVIPYILLIVVFLFTVGHIAEYIGD